MLSQNLMQNCFDNRRNVKRQEGIRMDMDELGFFIFMEEQERKEKEQQEESGNGEG